MRLPTYRSVRNENSTYLMGEFIAVVYTKVLYAPAFNLLVIVYNALTGLAERLPFSFEADMGMAVIVLTLFFNVLLLPLSRKNKGEEEEKFSVASKFEEIERVYRGFPVKIRQQKDKLIKSHRKVVRSTYVSYAIYFLYFLMFYRIFKTGLQGQDYGLLYSFVEQPENVNLVFIGFFDLTRANATMNTISALLTLVAEAQSIWFSPLPTTRDDYVALVFAPFAAYFLTSRIPSGQELFFTVSLLFLIIKSTIQKLWVVSKRLKKNEPSYRKYMKAAKT